MMRRMNIHYLLFFVLSLLPALTWAESFKVREISVLEINSAITPATLDYLQMHFKHIPRESLILIKMNTPGGLINTTKEIITLIGEQDKPVAIWVTPQGASAASAGAIIASSGHFIFMTPGTNMGAATPVGLGEDIKEKDGKAKALNDLKAMVRSLSETRGRPAAPFERMIETAESLTDQEALKAGILTAVVSSEDDLIKSLREKSFLLRGQKLQLEFSDNPSSKIYEPTLGQEILYVLANPSTAYFLFLIGVALLYFELQAPGGFIAGGIGICLLLLSAISFQVLPLDWGALALILAGLILLIMEVYITSYGLLALAGIGAFIAGSLFLFHGEGGFISIDYPVLISTLLGILFATGVLTWYLLRDRSRQKIESNFFIPIDSEGVVISQMGANSYQVKVRGEIWRAESENDLKIGDAIKIKSVDSDKLVTHVIKVHKE
jgi:membrane-bound serine protease (ClpP class)